MAIQLPVIPFVPGVPTPSNPETSGTGKSPGSPNTGTSFAGPSTGTIDYFTSRAIGLLHPSLTSHYRCSFNPTTVNRALLDFLKAGEGKFPGSDYFSNQELIELSCSEASLPGASLMTNEINDDYPGVTERPAYRRQYDDRIDFTFYVNHDYRIINFFERWISYCAGENDYEELDDRNYFYRVNFPDDYQVDALYVTKFEKFASPIIGKNKDTNPGHFGPTLTYKFIRAYPISINSMPISYDSSQLLKCTVSFSFVRYVRQWKGGLKLPPEPGPTRPPGVPNPPPTFPPIPDFPEDSTALSQEKIRNRRLGL